MKKRIYIKVYGRVTGVGFRYSARETAGRLGVAGYVKNCGDETLEIEAEGEEEKLKELLDWANTGPRYAGVDRVEYKWLENQDEFNRFRITY